jgi:hypothetical protein
MGALFQNSLRSSRSGDMVVSSTLALLTETKPKSISGAPSSAFVKAEHGGTIGRARTFLLQGLKDYRLKAVAFSAAFYIWRLQMRDQTLTVALATFLIVSSVGSVSAQVVSPELDACRSTGLIALKERNPSIKDVSFDVDGMTIAKANTKVEDTVIKTIVIGDAYLEKGKKDTRRTFLCLIGEKGKVVLTFFTDK